MTRRWLLVVAAAAVVIATPYLFMGPGWLLDDWWTLRNARFDVWWNAAGTDQWQVRPGAALVYALFFGVLRSPTLVYLVLVVINVAVAVQLVRFFRRFLPEPVAALIAVVWVVLPNHTTTDYWASAGNIGLAMFLTVTGALALTGTTTRSWIVAGGLFAVAALFYESSLALSAVAAVVVPLLCGRRSWRPTAIALGGCVAAVVWIALNFHPQKSIADVQDPRPVFQANFGWGVLTDPIARVGLAAAFAFLAYSAAVWLAALLRSSTGRLAGRPEALAVLGAVVLVAGVVPFVRYGYQPLGLGDRANVGSSIGAAMVWAGGVWRLWSVRKPLAVALVAIAATSMLVVRFDRAQTYSRAGDDAVAVLDVLEQRFPEPGEPVVVGPTPLICDNIVGFYDHENIGPAYQHRMDDLDYWATVSREAPAFERAPSDRRLDQHQLRPASSSCR